MPSTYRGVCVWGFRCGEGGRDSHVIVGPNNTVIIVRLIYCDACFSRHHLSRGHKLHPHRAQVTQRELLRNSARTLHTSSGQPSLVNHGLVIVAKSSPVFLDLWFFKRSLNSGFHVVSRFVAVSLIYQRPPKTEQNTTMG